MDSAIDYWSAKALLDWQIEMGADEAIADAPVDRYALQDKKPEPPKAQVAEAPPPPPAKAPDVDVVQEARDAAAAAHSLEGLHAALEAFEHCPLKAAARHTIFADGVAGSDVMILTDPPDRDDDRAGQLLSGPAGMLFDKMFAAIGLARDGLYVAPVMPWRPPNRDPNVQELAMMRPFLNRHIELAAPKLLVLMGNGPCQAMLERSGMTRMRGKWAEAAGLPALPMFAPAYLMGTPAAKRDAWADLLALKARLREMS